MQGLLGLSNLDLLTVGAVAAFMGVLGAVVFFSDRKNASNILFALFCVLSIVWSLLNYSFYKVGDAGTAFWIIRWVIAVATWFVFILFIFLSTFPDRTSRFSKQALVALSLCALGVSVLDLSPFVFEQIGSLAPNGTIASITNGPGIILFGFFVFICVLGGIFNFIKRFLRTAPENRQPLRLFLAGIVTTFALLLTFNFILPAFFNNPSFLELGALFIFPLILMASIALLRYKLMNAKTIAIGILTGFLAVVILGEVVFDSTLNFLFFFRISEFVFVLAFGILLIRSVTKEVEQREHIEFLAKNLEEANEKLKELDKLKSQFLSIASHDLRSPLTIIRNFISLLLEGAYGKLSDAGREGLQQVFDRATDMAKSVDTYLNVSRIEQGRMKYDFIEIELLPLIRSAVAAYAPNAEKKGLKLAATYDPALEGVKAKIDVAKINEVFNNLLDNTIKYTPSGSVDVSVRREGQIARITIKDTGVGMSKETIGKLFQLFSTADDSRKVNVTSTGVGLYITKAHVEAHGGRIWAESEGEGKGSTFIVELPVI
jgi:signal transduction histidine kinase